MRKITEVLVNASARHIHLTDEHVEILFGKGATLTPYKYLMQPGEFASEQCVTLEVGERYIENVRVLGPTRKKTQVEISKTDAYTLKIEPPIRESGNLEGSTPITLVGPVGTVHLHEGCIIANRHIHMTPEDAARLGIHDNEEVSVVIDSEKRTILQDVYCRISEKYVLEMHIDLDDANAACLPKGYIATVYGGPYDLPYE